MSERRRMSGLAKPGFTKANYIGQTESGRRVNVVFREAAMSTNARPNTGARDPNIQRAGTSNLRPVGRASGIPRSAGSAGSSQSNLVSIPVVVETSTENVRGRSSTRAPRVNETPAVLRIPQKALPSLGISQAAVRAPSPGRSSGKAARGAATSGRGRPPGALREFPSAEPDYSVNLFENQYTLPMRGDATAVSSPENLKQKLARYTPVTLSHYKPKVATTERAQGIYRSKYKDVLSGNVAIDRRRPAASDTSGGHASLDSRVDMSGRDEDWDPVTRELWEIQQGEVAEDDLDYDVAMKAHQIAVEHPQIPWGVSPRAQSPARRTPSPQRSPVRSPRRSLEPEVSEIYRRTPPCSTQSPRARAATTPTVRLEYDDSVGIRKPGGSKPSPRAHSSYESDGEDDERVSEAEAPPKRIRVRVPPPKVPAISVVGTVPTLPEEDELTESGRDDRRKRHSPKTARTSAEDTSEAATPSQTSIPQPSRQRPPQKPGRSTIPARVTVLTKETSQPQPPKQFLEVPRHDKSSRRASPPKIVVTGADEPAFGIDPRTPKRPIKIRVPKGAETPLSHANLEECPRVARAAGRRSPGYVVDASPPESAAEEAGEGTRGGLIGDSGSETSGSSSSDSAEPKASAVKLLSQAEMRSYTTPSMMDTPFGPIEATQEIRMESVSRPPTPKGTVVDITLTGRKRVSPGLVEEHVVTRRELIFPEDMSPDYVRDLVNEENHAIEDARDLMQSTGLTDTDVQFKLKRIKHKIGSVRILEESLSPCLPENEQTGAQMTAEDVVVFIRDEERGVPPEKPQEPPAAPSPERTHVSFDFIEIMPPKKTSVSASSSPKGSASQSPRESGSLEQAAQKSPSAEAAEPTAPKKDESTVKKVGVEAEAPPWNLELGSMENLIGLATPDGSISPDNLDLLGYINECNEPKHHSRGQLRGTTFPEWFPGFYSVFPNIEDFVEVKRTPSVVLKRAWHTLKPSEVLENSEIVIA